MGSIVLYSYYRSSASYRVRIALNLKNIDYRISPVHLLNQGGEQLREEYRALNPQRLVPTLVDGNHVFTQSSAIIEYLEEAYPDSPLLPQHMDQRAYVRALVQIIACDIHPLNNLRVLNFLKSSYHGEAEQQTWYCHWVHEGFSALEQLLKKFDNQGSYCFGNAPGMADAFLIPQVFNALRFGCDMGEFPLINEIYQSCMIEQAFIDASPGNQPDAEA